MLYAMLCYDSEQVIGGWTREEDDAVMARLDAVQDNLARQGKLGPVARLLPTRAARTVRKHGGLVLDGPFAETKEQLLGFFVVDCASEAEAIEIAQQLGAAIGSAGAFEVRPLGVYRPGVLPT